MRIDYPQRSKFLNPCVQALRIHKTDLIQGYPIEIYLQSARGFNETIKVKIEENDNKTFWSDWVGSDPTWFPSRIKAAAKALYLEKCFGEFEISHQSGRILIS